MDKKEDIYVTAFEKSNVIHLPAASVVTCFLLKYCKTQSFKIHFVKKCTGESDYPIRASHYEFCDDSLSKAEECPYCIRQCDLPAIRGYNGTKVLSGLCGVLRHIIQVSAGDSARNMPDLLKLLGYKKICLKACAEISSWTKFCEVEMTKAVDYILATNSFDSEDVTLPVELLKLENQFKQPCVIANASKRVQDAVKEHRKKHAGQDMAVANPLNALGDLQHNYVEGIDFTLADLVLLPCVILILDHWKEHLSAMKDKLPLVFKWMQRLSSRTEINTALMASHLPSHVLSYTDKHQKQAFVHLPTGDSEMFSIREAKKKKFKSSSTELDRAMQKLSNYHFSFQGVSNCCDVQLPWQEYPESVHPKDGDLPSNRLERKCQQLENLAMAVISMAKPGDIIVDFCSGGGHLGILLAYLLPDSKVVLVENKEESIQKAEIRIQKLQITNMIIYQCNLDYFTGKFDIGICLHACGVATDLVLQCCLDNQASFVICPCCYGNIQNTHTMTYPRSKAFCQTELTYKEYLCIGHGADQTQCNTPMEIQGKQCMNYIDSDRASVAKEHGYRVTLTTLKPAYCSPKNNLLIGTQE